ncbi:MAG: alkane 1-monooxygenase, partial [Perlucidibaca sp.]
MMIFHYLKYFFFHVIGLMSLAALVAGGDWVTIGLAVVLGIYLIGDAICGDDVATPRFRHPVILTVQLWMALPLLSLI